MTERAIESSKNILIKTTTRNTHRQYLEKMLRKEGSRSGKVEISPIRSSVDVSKSSFQN